MKISRTLVFAALGMLAFAPSSAADLFVCPTDPPAPPPPDSCLAQELFPVPGEVIELYVHESNGVNLTINVSNGFITNFLPEPSEVVEYHPIDFSSPTTQIHIAGVRANPTDPPTDTTFRLGSLIVDASDPSIIVEVAVGSEGVATGDDIQSINARAIAVPEPAQSLMLAAGSAALAALGRRRSRHAKRRV